MSKFITPGEAAKLAGVTRETISNLCKAKTIRYTEHGNVRYPLRADVVKYKKCINQIHEATTSIEEYKKQILDMEREVYYTQEQNHFQLVNMQMFPRRIEVLKNVLMSLIENFEHYTQYEDSELTMIELNILEDAMKGESFEKIGDRFSYGVSRERVRQIYVRVLNKIASGRGALRHLEKENEEMRQLLQKKNCEITILKAKLDGKPIESEFDDSVIAVSKILDMPIENFDLSARTRNCLGVADVNTIRELLRFHRADMLKYRNFGKKSLSELDELLEYHGLAWGMDVSKYPEYVKQLNNYYYDKTRIMRNHRTDDSR